MKLHERGNEYTVAKGTPERMVKNRVVHRAFAYTKHFRITVARTLIVNSFYQMRFVLHVCQPHGFSGFFKDVFLINYERTLRLYKKNYRRAVGADSVTAYEGRLERKIIARRATANQKIRVVDERVQKRKRAFLGVFQTADKRDCKRIAMDFG